MRIGEKRQEDARGSKNRREQVRGCENRQREERGGSDSLSLGTHFKYLDTGKNLVLNQV